MTREQMKDCVWLKPELVAQIEFRSKIRVKQNQGLDIERDSAEEPSIYENLV